MIHLNFDELFELAEASVRQDGFDDTQIEQLEHLKTCRDCYESFCLLSSLSDVMSESGSFVFTRSEAVPPINDTTNTRKVKILAKFHVFRESAVNAFGVALEQIDQATSMLKFGPSLAVATRGEGKPNINAIRLEEFEDDKTYIVFKSETNEIGLQINTRGIEVDNLHVYIEFADLSRVEVPAVKRGNIIKGTISNIPNSNFHIVIQAE